MRMGCVRFVYWVNGTGFGGAKLAIIAEIRAPARRLNLYAIERENDAWRRLPTFRSRLCVRRHLPQGAPVQDYQFEEGPRPPSFIHSTESPGHFE
jgi:hypothetical protein